MRPDVFIERTPSGNLRLPTPAAQVKTLGDICFRYSAAGIPLRSTGGQPSDSVRPEGAMTGSFVATQCRSHSSTFTTISQCGVHLKCCSSQTELPAGFALMPSSSRRCSGSPRWQVEVSIGYAHACRRAVALAAVGRAQPPFRPAAGAPTHRRDAAIWLYHPVTTRGNTVADSANT